MLLKVAPLAGARIEICKYPNSSSCIGSLPSRERGLKSYLLRHTFGTSFVAPLAGARIEILYWVSWYPQPLSLPSRERGLKSLLPSTAGSKNRSLPSRERGLKSIYISKSICYRRRSPRGSAD